jgi:hypothetical protein
MRETVVEKHLHKCVREVGGDTRKIAWPGRRGAPDRLVMLPGAKKYLIETKAPQGRLKKYQQREHDRLRSFGWDVRVLFTREQVNWFIDEVTG